MPGWRHPRPGAAASMPALLALTLGLLQPAAASAELPPELREVEGAVVLVDFWASWCAPCRRSFPWMNRMLAQYRGDGLEIVAVNVDTERAAADEFLATTPADFTIRFDPEGTLAERFDVQAMPSSFLLDASGTVLAVHYGFRTAEAEEYENQIRNALDERRTVEDTLRW